VYGLDLGASLPNYRQRVRPMSAKATGLRRDLKNEEGVANG
jgi:hypothetical protein